MTHVRRGFLTSQGGFSLIAMIVEATVLLVAFLGLYIGIVYAEAQLVQNYHTRVATLLAAGEVDQQIRYIKLTNEPRPIGLKTVTIEQYPDGSRLQGTMTLNHYLDEDLSSADPLVFHVVEVQVRWRNPADSKTRSIMVREDFFR